MRTWVFSVFLAQVVLVFFATSFTLQGGLLVGIAIAFVLLVTDLTNGWSGWIDVLVRTVGFACAAVIAAAGVYTGLWYNPETFKGPAFGTLVTSRPKPIP